MYKLTFQKRVWIIKQRLKGVSPSKVALAVRLLQPNGDKYLIGGSHLSGAMFTAMLRSLNIPAREEHTPPLRRPPEYHEENPYTGHGALEIFLGDDDVAYMDGNFVYSRCLKPPIPTDKFLLDKTQFNELVTNDAWLIAYYKEVNPGCR